MGRVYCMCTAFYIDAMGEMIFKLKVENYMNGGGEGEMGE